MIVNCQTNQIVQKFSLDQVVEQIINIIILFSKATGLTKADILAKIIEKCLMSADEDENHIYAFDLFSKCDNCFKGEI